MANAQTGDNTLRTILIVLAVIVLFPLLMMVFAFPMMGMMGWWGGYGPMMGGYGGYGGSGLSPLWGIGMMLVFLAVLVGVGYFLYRALLGGRRVTSTSDPALEELRLAYARGDLSEEEFERRRSKLQVQDELETR